MNVRMLRVFALVAVGICASNAALARDSNNVDCAVSATGISFGQYSPLATAPLDVAGSITTFCRRRDRGGGNGYGQNWWGDSVPYTVTLSAGAGGNFSARAMRSGANSLSYNIYTDPTYSVVVGDGSGGSQAIQGRVTLSPWGGFGYSTSTVYGRIPAGQNAAPGAYGDLLIVTVNY